MRLISDFINEDVKLIAEDKEGKKTYYVEGIAAQAGIPNRNRRLYPPDVLAPEIDRYIKEKVETGSSFGELSHPDSPQIHLDRVSHIFREVKRDKNDWYAKAALTDTPCGSIARGLLEAGGRLGFSTRGLGTLKNDEKNGWNIVQSDYKLSVLADLVADPSAPSAYVKGVLEGITFHQTESGDWVAEKVAEKVAEHIEDTKKELEKKSIEEIKRDASPTFNKFFEMLSLVQEEYGSERARLAKRANTTVARVDEVMRWAQIQALKEGRANDIDYIKTIVFNYLGVIPHN